MKKTEFILNLADGRDEPIKDLDGASRIVIVDEKTINAEDITFGYSKFEPHTAIHKKHAHTEAEEIMYILKGKGITGIKDEEFELSAGETLFVPRGETHWFYNPFDEPCEFIFIYTKSSLAKAGYRIGL